MKIILKIEMECRGEAPAKNYLLPAEGGQGMTVYIASIYFTILTFERLRNVS